MALNTLANDMASLPLKAIPLDLKIDRLIQVDQFRVATLIASGLFKVGKNLEYEGKLAKNSYWDKDRRKLFIELKDEHFSDGSVLHSEHVINSLKNCIKTSRKNTTSSFDKILGYKEFVSGKTTKLKGLKEIDDHNLVIEAEDYVPLLKEDLTLVACSIIKSIKPGSNNLLDGAIGTGAYRVLRSSKNEIILGRRKGKGPNRVKFFATNDFGNYQKLKDSADLILTESDIGKLKDFNSHRNSRLGNWQLSFNNQKTPFNNKLLRKAISLGIDFDSLYKNMGWEEARLQRGLFPFGMRGFRKRESIKRNLAEANKILKTLGHTNKKPLEFKILLSKKNGTDKVVSIWAQAFKGLNANPTIKVVDQGELIKLRNKGQFNIIFHGKASGSPDPHIILSSYLSDSRFNTPRVKNTRCDFLIRDSIRTHNTYARWEKYKKAEDCLLDTYFIVPLATVNYGLALVRKPWRITRKNQYLLYPYRVDEWEKDSL